jgi:predicted RNA-binding Zn-ribbon protein involved in translation (DUF1610 family)
MPVIRPTRQLLTNVVPALRRARSNLQRRARSRGPRAVVDCPDCGEGRIEPMDVTVRARIESDEWSYRFVCPSCTRRTVASTSRAAALEAVEAGAALETWRWSTEPRVVDLDASPLTFTDLLDLRVALSEPDWLETFSTSGNGTNDSER